MSFRQDHSGGNKAVALLATCCVVFGGLVCCTAIAVAADPEHVESALVPVGGVIAGAVVLLWILRDRPPESRLWSNWNWLAGRGKRRVAYRVKPKVPPGQRVVVPPAPPTAESIRAITGREPNGLTHTWVPTSTTRPKSPGDQGGSAT